MINRYRSILIFFAASALIPLRGISSSVSNNDPDSTATRSFYGGLRFEKAAGFYWYNGFTAEYTSQKIAKQRIGFGLNLLSSRLGSALSSNAIPFFEIDLSGSYHFRHNKDLQPSIRLNAGYAHANYGSDIFNRIPDHSFIISFEGGMSYDLRLPLRITLNGGYNLLTGNGISGLGTIYPVYLQCSLLYRILPG
jgi:hypothetical protein